jgi:hypothetical protein
VVPGRCLWTKNDLIRVFNRTGVLVFLAAPDRFQPFNKCYSMFEKAPEISNKAKIRIIEAGNPLCPEVFEPPEASLVHIPAKTRDLQQLISNPLPRPNN